MLLNSFASPLASRTCFIVDECFSPHRSSDYRSWGHLSVVLLNTELVPPRPLLQTDAASLRSLKGRGISRRQTSNSVDLLGVKRLRTSHFGFSMTSLLGKSGRFNDFDGSHFMTGDSGARDHSPFTTGFPDNESLVQTNESFLRPSKIIPGGSSKSLFNRLSSVIRFKSASSSKAQREDLLKQPREVALRDRGLISQKEFSAQECEDQYNAAIAMDTDDLEFQCRGESAATRIKRDWEARNRAIAATERQKLTNFRFGSSTPNLIITETNFRTLKCVVETSSESPPPSPPLLTPCEGLFETSTHIFPARSRPPSPLQLAPFPNYSRPPSMYDPDFEQALLVPLPLSPFLSPMIPSTYDARFSADEYFPVFTPLPPSPPSPNSPVSFDAIRHRSNSSTLDELQPYSRCHCCDDASVATPSRSRSTSESNDSSIATPSTDTASHGTLEFALNLTGGKLKCSARPKMWASERGHGIAIIVESPMEETMDSGSSNINSKDEVAVSSSAVIVVHGKADEYAGLSETKRPEIIPRKDSETVMHIRESSTSQRSQMVDAEIQTCSSIEEIAEAEPKPKKKLSLWNKEPLLQHSDTDSAISRLASIRRTVIDSISRKRKHNPRS
ncbi:hypothetical protein Moror_3928 [Moniliophthora roreri MCA 2997]|uniref:Uncharacterized protein n=1 Tax=Moniliophthora roreri (strain MCA 2997) TaxID=1381753 RepID=V2XR18_MONRO|nr:hypothetical protein Moror_3928 [Moniliophthora roreri MCA 2997]